MRPPPFCYADPGTVDEALGLLAEHGDDAGILAGGQSFVPLLNFRLARPTVIVDINRIAELDYIEQKNGALEIGSLTRHRAVEQSALVSETCPLLSEAIAHVGHVQIRNRGTVGGSLAHADPAAELPAVVTALGGSLRLCSASGERTLDPGDFFVSSLTTAIEPGEMLVAVELPGVACRDCDVLHRVQSTAGGFRPSRSRCRARVRRRRAGRAGGPRPDGRGRPAVRRERDCQRAAGRRNAERSRRSGGVGARAKRRGALVRHARASGLSQAFGRRDGPAGAARRRATRDIGVKGGSDG